MWRRLFIGLYNIIINKYYHYYYHILSIMTSYYDYIVGVKGKIELEVWFKVYIYIEGREANNSSQVIKYPIYYIIMDIILYSDHIFPPCLHN